MPHFGLMDPRELGPAKAALQRARLHIRAGKRRLRQDKVPAGLATLYDALHHAMKWYLLAHRRADPRYREIDAECEDEALLFDFLVRCGVIRSTFDFKAFSRVTHDALEHGHRKVEYGGLVSGLDRVMTDLEVMPFDEDSLPPEDPRTF